MTLRLCDPLGDDWPTPPVCTGCTADIRPGQRYAILPGTLTVLCAPCAGQPAAGSVSTRRESAGASVFGGTEPHNKRAHGQWALSHTACVEHGGTEHPHAARGLCTRCYHRQAEARRRDQRRAAS